MAVIGNQHTIDPALLAELKRRAAETRERFAHKPGLDELFTPEQLADAAPFYFELMAFVRAMRKAREALGRTAEEVAAEMRVEPDRLLALEDGRVVNPSWQMLGRYALAVGRDLALTSPGELPPKWPVPAPAAAGSPS